ncbi:MAG: hypothetical protein NTX33_19835 [Propionibacteriales bacterium]|nr:hypothetical protein [Propionibacteriales bacterium]
MFDLINGIPLHPLVVHAIVVLLPLATLGTLAIAVRPSWRRPYGPLVVAAALVATVLCPVATSSGEELEHRVGEPGQHAELGEQLIWFAIALLVFSAALVWLDRKAARADAPSMSPTLPRVVATLAVVAALACAVQVYRVGDSGARAAWGDAVAPQSAPAQLTVTPDQAE